MRVLVIGTSGQLATELRRRPWPTKLERIDAERIDLTSASKTLSALDRLEPELILNAAAYTAVDRAEQESLAARALNTDGPATLAMWCARRAAALVHVSTDYVFDGSAATPYDVDVEPHPLGVYGQSKLDGELAIKAQLAQHIIVRTSWVFSAHGHNFVKTMLRLAREKDELRVVADQWGRPTPAADLADALLLVARRVQDASAVWGTFHFAGDGSTTWHGLAQAVVDQQVEHTGKHPRVTPIATSDYPTPARRPANSVLDTTRFDRAYGWAQRPWTAGLKQVIDELLSKA